MSADVLRWFADQLALPRIDVAADGTAAPNDAAQTLGARAGGDARTIVRAVLGASALVLSGIALIFVNAVN